MRCAPSFANKWLIPRLHGFLMQRPDLDVHIVSRMHGYGHSWTARESESTRCGAAKPVISQ